ncbi:glycosyltransferase [Sphingomonas sp. RB3P16]|uniref:glycosyltransferase n=1 Tax=Parasphingomonas frigoris TaxID=3096163 RepID=UPI002FCAAA40
MRHAILLGSGKYSDEIKGFSAEDQPEKEFIAIAKLSDARVFSLASSDGTFNNSIRTMFSKRPNYGSALKFAASAKDIDACYVTGEDLGIPAAIILKARAWRGKLYCVVHNITPKKAFLFRRIGHKMFGGFIVVSKRQRSLLVEQCNIPSEKVFLRYNCVDDTFFKPISNASSQSGPDSAVMACGAENRDYALLREAARALDTKFEIYGHGFFGDRSDNSDAGSPPNFASMPRVSFPELAHAYNRSRAVVLPLNDVDYAAGVTGLVEAMACGKTVIVTKTTGIEGYLDAIEPTLLLKPNDVDYAIEVFKNFNTRSQAENDAAGARNREWILKNCAQSDYAEFVRDLMESRPA